MLLKDELA